MQARLPEFITFTGVDNNTNLNELISLSADYPVEFGVLHSKSKQGIENRFPDRTKLGKIWECADEVAFAAHLCGGWSKDVLQGLKPDVLTHVFSRVQVNFVPNPLHHPYLNGGNGWKQCYDFHAKIGKPVIIQHRTLTWPSHTTGLQFLFDKSGGRGESPKNYPKNYESEMLRGFAGGLGPHNIREEIDRIASEGPYWLDMEGQVRTDDWFDLTKVRSVLEQVYGK